jgi:transposase
MKELPNDIEELKAIIAELWEKLKHLERENAELRRRLDLDSKNSHKPPSSDGYKKTTKPGIPKDEKHPRGGQKGHEGKTLRKVSQLDHVEVHLPARCECCGRSFTEEDKYEILQSRQVFDIPEPRLEVTAHQIGEISCCGVKQKGKYPKAVRAPVQYGAGVQALVTKLSVDHKMPLNQISQLFTDLYDYELNSTTIETALKRGYSLAESLENQNISHLLAQEVVHFDETGIRIDGKLRWLHVASTATHTHLFVHEKRGQQALESDASVLKDFKGRAVHDCWSSYFKFEGLQHALCGAHLLRELNNLIENDSLWAEDMHEFLLDLYKNTYPTAKSEQIREHYHIILAQADLEEPPPQASKRGRPKQSRGRNLFNRLKRYEEGVLAFALDPDVPFTNNQAERDLRGAKVKQKVSGCFRTLAGAHTYARLQALILTLRKQEIHIFSSLRSLFSYSSLSPLS